MINKLRIAILLLTIFASSTVLTQDKKGVSNPVNISATSQTIAPDARAAGISDVSVATSPDVNSQYWSPAKYPFNISRTGVPPNYTPWLRQLVNDIDLIYLVGHYRIGDYGVVSASMRYFFLGEVQMTDGSSMTINPYEMSMDVAYSLILSKHFSLDAAVCWIYSNLTYNYTDDTAPGSAFAADLSCYYQNYINIDERGCQLGLGMNISNTGSKITFDGSNRSEFVPTNPRLDASLMIPTDKFGRFTIAADADKLLVPTYPKRKADEAQVDCDNRLQKEYYDVSSISSIFKNFGDAPNGAPEELQEIQWSLGTEYTYSDKFSLRVSYHYESGNKGNRKYFAVGAGFKTNVFSLDARYVIATAKNSPLDQTLHFSLLFDMDDIEDLFKKK